MSTVIRNFGLVYLRDKVDYCWAAQLQRLVRGLKFPAEELRCVFDDI